MEDKTIQLPVIETDNACDESETINYLVDSCSDVGTCRAINQDACCVRMLKAPSHMIVLAVVCDGVGGMEEGEYASKSTVQSFHNWFDYKLSKIVMEEKPHQLFTVLSEAVKILIEEQNQVILSYARKKGIHIGTTLTAMLFVDHSYFIAQIGDSRAYCMKEKLTQLTEDQSLVAKEVREGKLTEEEARFDKRRNIILQCLGASENLVPVYQSGIIQRQASYFLCSDGFVHQFRYKELEEAMNMNDVEDISRIHNRLLQNIETVKKRGEKDNITVVLVRTV